MHPHQHDQRIRVGRRQAARLGAVLLALAAIFHSLPAPRKAHAQSGSSPNAAAIPGQVHFEQQLGAAIPAGLEFVDSSGQRVAIESLTSGQPAILILAYYRCPMLCTLVLDGAADALAAIALEPSEDYGVIVISIDPRETSDLAASNERAFLDRFDRSVDPAGIHFLTGRKNEIDLLADAIGYRYVYDGQTEQFAHPSGLVILTGDERVSKYLLGIEYAPSDVRLALVEASAGKIGTLVDQVMLLCYQYDPATGRYGLVILNALRLGGALTVLIIAGAIGIMLWRERRHRRNARRGGERAAAPDPCAGDVGKASVN